VKQKTGITERIATLLIDNQEEADFSKVLATIRKDAPVSFHTDDANWHAQFTSERALALFTELGFRSLIPRLNELATLNGSAPAAAHTATTIADEGATLHEEQHDPHTLKEAAVMLWLLHSETTNPSINDILQKTEAPSLDEAHAKLAKEIEKNELRDVYERIEKPLIPVIEKINQTGVLVDMVYMKALSKEYHDELRVIGKKIYSYAGVEFNINSPKQLGEVLFEKLDIKADGARRKKTATGQLSTKESELIKLKDAHPIVEAVLQYRELAKLLGTYIDAIPPLLGADGRLRTTFSQTGTTTGRLSSRDPNVQNIPIKSEIGRRIRRAFIAEKGNMLVAFDYSQIELRLAAFLSGDEKLRDIFQRGEDVHTAVASRMFAVPENEVTYEMRRRAKVINFGILYGMGVNALMQNLKVPRAEAQDYLNVYFETFAGLAEYLEKTKAEAARQGYVTTHFGRRRYFPGIKSSLPYVRAQAERMAINAPLQGTQADIIKLAMVHIDKKIEQTYPGDATMILQIHDELIFEVAKDSVDEFCATAKTVMESIITEKETGVPITVSGEVGLNWGEMERV
jgi:DNA polymerase I